MDRSHLKYSFWFFQYFYFQCIEFILTVVFKSICAVQSESEQKYFRKDVAR